MGESKEYGESLLIVPGLLKSMVEQRRTLTRGEARALLRGYLAVREDAFEERADEMKRAAELSSLLTAMAVRGETAEELAGFAQAMREAATPLPLSGAERERLVDTCGTGGDGLGTFNISTGAALVAAAAGAKVAKHGNRAVTSKCGSADVLEALGVPVGLGPERAVECLRETGFMFLLATALHPAMRRVAAVRRALGFRTIFNLAGPLTNPAGARAQVMGVWAEDRLGVVAEAMGMLGVRHALVVHGEAGEPGQGVDLQLDQDPIRKLEQGWGKQGYNLGEELSEEQGRSRLDSRSGLDELTVTGTSHGVEVRGTPGEGAVPGGETTSTIRRFRLEPEELGLTRAPLAALGGGGSAEESAGVLLAIFRGDERGPRREIVLLNAAAALIAAGIAADWREGLERAAAAVDSGAVMKVVAGLRGFAR